MKEAFSKLRKTFISGLIFMLPILILLVVLTKIFGMLTGLSKKIAALFGIGSIMGISGSTIASTIVFILVCLVFGYLVRFSFAQRIRNWIDGLLLDHIPGYEAYKRQAMSKLEPEEEVLPYKVAVWVNENGMRMPGFLVETNAAGDCVVFFPAAGDAKHGTIMLVPSSQVSELPNTDLNAFNKAINGYGKGLASF